MGYTKYAAPGRDDPLALNMILKLRNVGGGGSGDRPRLGRRPEGRAESELRRGPRAE